MTAFLIVAIICIVVGIASSKNAQQNARHYRAINRGSRAVEIEEWDKWSRLLLKEHNELIGLNIPYPEIKKNKRL